ncbi:Abi family protein [Nocardioides sp.]|uniref:Abi family protein n=1 Tax=Nocardioides sp. TaxID=35761 RepID=UPI00321A2B10
MASKHYAKPSLTIEAQVRLLRSRGMDVGDPKDAAACLRRVGYYRLSGYWYPFREYLPRAPEPKEASSAAAGRDGTGVAVSGSGGEAEDGTGAGTDAGAGSGAGRRVHSDVPERRSSQFVAGTSLTTVEAAYEFDRELRMSLFDAIENIEIALRSRVGYLLGQGHAFAHRDPSQLHSAFTGQVDQRPGMAHSNWLDSNHAEWLRGVDHEEDRSAETFVHHIRHKYGPPMPVWAATEIMSFGALSRLYSGMERAQQDRVAAALGIFADNRGQGSTLANWLNHIRYVRNMCAHHARLWNRNITVQLVETPDIAELAHLDGRSRSRLYATLAVVGFLLERIAPGNAWRGEIISLVSSRTSRLGQDMSTLGFPDGWDGLDLWSSDYTLSNPEWEERQEILDRLPAMSSGELGRLLRPEDDVKKQLNWIRYLRNKRLLLGLWNGSSYDYPVFQIDREAGDLAPGVAQVNTALLAKLEEADHLPEHEAGWAAAQWWSSSQAVTDGRTPADLTTTGELAPLAEAVAVAANLAAS